MKLSVVATPIGNLEDLTLRALRTLREADTVLCEDTRVTKKLLVRYEVETPLLSYHARSGGAKYDKIAALLEAGKHLALVSDAGTPAVSDPGHRLVEHIRERFGAACAIETVPGPSALTAALAVAGMHTHEFVFLGFLPHKKGRETLFAELAVSPRATVMYESPHRLMKTLTTLRELLSPKRRVAVCRELTKLHEEVVRGPVEAIVQHFEAHPERVRGEFVLIVDPAQTVPA